MIGDWIVSKINFCLKLTTDYSQGQMKSPRHRRGDAKWSFCCHLSRNGEVSHAAFFTFGSETLGCEGIAQLNLGCM